MDIVYRHDYANPKSSDGTREKNVFYVYKPRHEYLQSTQLNALVL